MPPVVTPFIPQYITVHLGAPSSNAPNVTVSFSDYVKENNIDKVLLIGNIDYFTMDEFELED